MAIEGFACKGLACELYVRDKNEEPQFTFESREVVMEGLDLPSDCEDAAAKLVMRQRDMSLPPSARQRLAGYLLGDCPFLFVQQKGIDNARGKN